MASTYSTNLAIELIGTGDQAGTWGVTTNTNLGTLIEQAISGYVTQAVSTGADTTITIPNGSTGVARNMYIELTGTGGTNTNLIVPANKKLYFVFNNTASGQVTVKVSGQTGVSVPNGKKMILVSNGTDIVNGINYIQDFGTNSFTVTNLVATSATITNLIATTASVSDLSATVLRSSSGTITNLLATTASISDASATVLRSASATLTHLSATSASITNLALTSLTISSLNITNVTVASATVSSNLTLSGGTANGVLYLNGSKVATSGSALTFDGSNLGVTLDDATTNTVANLLTLTKTTSGTAASGIGAGILFKAERASGGLVLNRAAIYGVAGTQVDDDGDMAFYTLTDTSGSGFSEKMRLNSDGNLGIGTSSPNLSAAAAGSQVMTISASSSGRNGILELNGTRTSSNEFSGYVRFFNNGAATPLADIIAIRGSSDTSGDLAFATANTERARIDASGNLGIGTSSPNAALNVIRNSASFVSIIGGSTAGGTGLKVFNSDTARSSFVVLGEESGTNSTPALLEKFGSTHATRANEFVINNAVSGPLTFRTNDVECMRLDSAGNLGLGVTPSAWAFSGLSALQIKNAGFSGYSNNAYMTANMYFDGSGSPRYIATAAASQYVQTSGAHQWYSAASGTAGNVGTFTQAMTLDASGNLGVGETSPSSFGRMVVANTSAGAETQGLYLVNASTTANTAISLSLMPSNATTRVGRITAVQDGAQNIALTFSTSAAASPVERARITSGGYFKASNDGTYESSTGPYHEIRNNASDNALKIASTPASNPYGIDIKYVNAAPNGTGNAFLYCSDSAALRANIRSNGGLANYQANNVDLSDARTKKDINPAASMWDKIGALEIVTYKYNDQTHDDVNVGVIAQQVESVEPVWVDSDGFGETPKGEEPLKTVYTKDIYFAAIKALQEAMARIEQLETKVAALESK